MHPLVSPHRVGVAALLLLLTIPAWSATITLEADAARLIGTRFSTEGAGFAGTGFLTDFISESNRVVWEFPAVAGNYDLQISFRSPYGHKDFEAVLNGAPSTGSFPHCAVFSVYDAGLRQLNDGTNHLEIGGGMSWYDINRAVFIPAASTPATNRLGATGPEMHGVQIDVKSLLNARPVTTWTDGKVISWTEGLDGDWSGEATSAAATAMGTSTFGALPGDGRFPATDRHPEVRLNFADTDDRSPQVRRSEGADAYDFSVPQKNYSQFLLFCLSANGSSKIDVALSYLDGYTEEKRLEVPDWYNPIPEKDPNRFNLARDLAKWSKSNQMMETNHHYLYGLNLEPQPGRVLNHVAVHKSPGGTLTFWGATGVCGSE